MLGHGLLHGHAAAEAHLERTEVELVETRSVQQRVEQCVDPGEEGRRMLGDIPHEPGEVARIRDQDVVPAELHEQQATAGEREDVVQRQRRHQLHLATRSAQLGAHPRLGLQHVRDHVAVREHGALRDTRGAAGVLQERDVVVSQRHSLEILELALAQRLVEADGAGQRVFRDLLLHVPQREVHEQRLREREQVADAGDDHRLDAGLVDHLLQRVGEVLEDQDRPGARVLELVLELAGRVQRIGVDDGQARAERGGNRDRVLQDVGQHDGDAVALLQARHLLQVGRELPAQAVDVAERERAIHARVGRLCGELRKAALHKGLQRSDFVRVDLGRHAGRVVLQPDLVHGDPLRSAECRRWTGAS